MSKRSAYDITLNDIRFLVYVAGRKRVPESVAEMAEDIGLAENTLRYSVLGRISNFGLIEEKRDGRIIVDRKRYDLSIEGRELIKPFTQGCVDVPFVILSIIIAIVGGMMLLSIILFAIGDVLKALIILLAYLLPIGGIIVLDIKTRRRAFIKKLLRGH